MTAVIIAARARPTGWACSRTYRRCSCTPRRHSTRWPTPAITKDDVDAVLRARSVAGTGPGGRVPRHHADVYRRHGRVAACSFMIHVRHAVAAIKAGSARPSLITHGESGRSRVGVGVRFGASPQMLAPVRGAVRVVRPADALHDPDPPPHARVRADAMSRWHRSPSPRGAGPSEEPAGGHPRADHRRGRATSRVIAYPVHLLECCLVTDGGGALVVVSAERAKDFRGSRRATSSAPASRPRLDDQPDARLHGVARVQVSGRLAFAEAGIERERHRPR